MSIYFIIHLYIPSKIHVICNMLQVQVSLLEFNAPFQHKYGYFQDEKSRVESYPYPEKKASDILIPPTQKGKEIERLIQIITLAHTTGRQLSHCKTTKSNTTKTSMHS